MADTRTTRRGTPAATRDDLTCTGSSTAVIEAGRSPGATPNCCGPTALFGWSPPPLPADTELKRRVDRLLPRSGVPFVLFFAAVVALLNVGAILPVRLDLVAVSVASLSAGGWCAVNFWRCRHAHCVITGTGWLALAGFTLFEAGLGRSLIHGDEGLVFLGVLAAGLVFEGVWSVARGTNAVSSQSS
jgi:hypothetical protein